MGVLQETAQVAKRVRKALLLDVIRSFPGLTEEVLRSSLDSWQVLRTKTETELMHYAENGFWPGETPIPDTSPKTWTVQCEPKEQRLMGHVHHTETAFISESKALRVVEELAPKIPPETMKSFIYITVEAKRKTIEELEFFARFGYWPETTPYDGDLERPRS